MIVAALFAGWHARAELSPQPAIARWPVPSAADLAHAAPTTQPGLELTTITPADRPRRLIARSAAQPFLPTTRYLLLSAARDTAVTLGDATSAIAAVRALADSFEIDVIALEHRTLNATAARAATPPEFAALARLGMEVVKQQLASATVPTDYTTAAHLAAATSTWALASRDAGLQVKAQGWSHDVQSLCDEAARIAPALTRLQSVPTDPDANLAVGRLLCFNQNDWTRGLPHLAKGSDPALAALANLELTQGNNAQSWSQLGDGWWDQGRTLEGAVQSRLRTHACLWYARSLPHVIGPRRALIDRRAAEAGFNTADLENMRSPTP